MEKEHEDEISTTSTKKSGKKTISETVHWSDNLESTSTSGYHGSLRPFSAELSNERKVVKMELSKACNDFNLLIFMVYLQLCFNWYLIGTQWSPHNPHKIILPEIECDIKSLRNTNWTFYERRNITTPKHEKFVPGCVYYDFNYASLAILSYPEAQTVIETMTETTPILKCHNYIFERDVPKEISPIREFNAFCIRKSFIKPLLFGHFGVIAFSFPAGLLADIYGRKPVYIACSIIVSLSSVLLISSTNFIMFSVASFTLKGSLFAINIVLTIIYSELYRHRLRATNTIVTFIFFVLGYTLISCKSVYSIIEVWRLQELVFTLASLAVVFGATMATVESPRFLLKRKQFKKAWDCLKELGVEEIKPGVQDHEFSKPSLKYQLKIFTKLYFVQRMYTILILNGASLVFINLFTSIKTEILIPSDDFLQFQFFWIQALLLIGVGIASMYYSKKILACVHYMLLSLCLFFNVLKHGSKLTDLTTRVGYILSIQILIIIYTYLIEVFPTTHRGTSMGFYFSIIYVLQVAITILNEELALDDEFKFVSGFYCGLCVICALISSVTPESSAELPDRKQDLFIKLRTPNAHN